MQRPVARFVARSTRDARAICGPVALPLTRPLSSALLPAPPPSKPLPWSRYHDRRDDVVNGYGYGASLAITTRGFATFRFATRQGSRASGASSSTPQPPPLPDASIVRVGNDCALEYIDLPGTTTSTHRTPTLILLHGAPGTYRDFRHLIPQLQQHLPSARIVGINFPGFGGSSVDEERYFELLDAQRAAQLTLQAVQQLVGNSGTPVFLIGHSFGGHAALNLAALNITAPSTDTPPLSISGLVLLAAAGTRPHRVLRPRQSAFMIHAMQSSPAFVRHALAQLLKMFYTTLLRFPSDFPASHYVAGILRAGTTDFSVVRNHVALLHAARVRSLSAWSKDDEFMEDEIPTALAAALGSNTRLAFRGAGHNLQKTRAGELAREIALWVENDNGASQQEKCDNGVVEIRP